jgi:hypothetical protein
LSADNGFPSVSLSHDRTEGGEPVRKSRLYSVLAVLAALGSFVAALGNGDLVFPP